MFLSYRASTLSLGNIQSLFLLIYSEILLVVSMCLVYLILKRLFSLYNIDNVFSSVTLFLYLRYIFAVSHIDS
jgi:Golgi nucleoside diphosphatase